MENFKGMTTLDRLVAAGLLRDFELAVKRGALKAAVERLTSRDRTVIADGKRMCSLAVMRRGMPYTVMPQHYEVRLSSTARSPKLRQGLSLRTVLHRA